jgi:hypothetical protein
MNSPERQKRSISEYVELEGETVTRAKNATLEHHYDTTDDVQTNIESHLKHEMQVSLSTFLESAVARKLFSRTLEHPEWGTLIAWAPTEWVVELANPHPLADTNTGGADGLPDRRVDLTTLFEDMLTHGMRDPFILGIGLDKRTRLETGNQRIQCALHHGVAFVPVISYVNDTDARPACPTVFLTPRKQFRSWTMWPASH